MQLDIINQVASSRNYDSAEGGSQKISSVFYITRKSSLFKKFARVGEETLGK